jgi:hypothetical protein
LIGTFAEEVRWPFVIEKDGISSCMTDLAVFIPVVKEVLKSTIDGKIEMKVRKNTYKIVFPIP